MYLRFRPSFRCAAVSIFVAAMVGCATTASSSKPFTAGGQASIEGTITAIDTTPWAFDGNAVIQLESDANGRVSVHLPARWNLCKAPAIDVEALAVGRRARVVGTVGGAGEIVVCERLEHRLQMLEKGVEKGVRDNS